LLIDSRSRLVHSSPFVSVSISMIRILSAPVPDKFYTPVCVNDFYPLQKLRPYFQTLPMEILGVCLFEMRTRLALPRNSRPRDICPALVPQTSTRFSAIGPFVLRAPLYQSLFREWVKVRLQLHFIENWHREHDNKLT
jgi:hypothetical protein